MKDCFKKVDELRTPEKCNALPAAITLHGGKVCAPTTFNHCDPFISGSKESYRYVGKDSTGSLQLNPCQPSSHLKPDVLHGVKYTKRKYIISF